MWILVVLTIIAVIVVIEATHRWSKRVTERALRRAVFPLVDALLRERGDDLPTKESV